MSTHDKQGRPWAKLSELKAGDVVEIDSSFTCMTPNQKYTVYEDRKGEFAILCNEGKHWLCGNEPAPDSIIGVYHAK